MSIQSRITNHATKYGTSVDKQEQQWFTMDIQNLLKWCDNDWMWTKICNQSDTTNYKVDNLNNDIANTIIEILD